MVDDKIVEYFKKWKSKGYSDEQIRKFLLGKGFSIDVIDDASTVASLQEVSNSPIRPPADPSRKKMWTIAMIVFVCCVGVISVYFISERDIGFDMKGFDMNIFGAKNTSDNSGLAVGSDILSTNATADRISQINISDGKGSSGSSDTVDTQTADNHTYMNNSTNLSNDYDINNTANINNTNSTIHNTTNSTNATKIYNITWSGGSRGGGGGGGSNDDDDEEVIVEPPVVPTCNDGILNQDELNIDCGGVCDACVCAGSNNQSCNITGGSGIQYRNCTEYGNWTEYDECEVVSCDIGYYLYGNICDVGFVIDHTTTDAREIPVCWIEKAKNDLRITYSHTSHGGQPIDGMWALKNFSSLYDYKSLWNWADSSWTNSTLYFREYEGYGGNVFPGLANASRPRNASDLSRNLDWWDNLTRRYLDGETGGGVGENTTTIVWTWGGTYNENNETIPYYLDPEIIQTGYLDKMRLLMDEYDGVNKRKVTFVLMTVHVDQWTNRSNENNAVIREWCENNTDCILYDFADMEEYDPLGQNYVNQNIGQSLRFDCNSDYNWTCNWATDYLMSGTSNITYDYNLTEIMKQKLFADRFDYAGVVCDHSPGWNATSGEPSIGESRDSVLNCALKGQAAWHLWARLAGWDGDVTDTDCDGPEI